MNNKELPATWDRTEDGINQFCQSIILLLNDHFPEGTQIERVCIQKNNGVFKDSICIREPGENCSPAICIEDYYTLFSEGAEFDSITEAIIEDYEKYKKEITFDMSIFHNYEWIKEHVGFKLTNYATNVKMLKEMPHVRFLDLAIAVVVDVTEITGIPSTCAVLNRHMEAWNVGPAELIKKALENMACKNPARLQIMMEILDELSGGNHMEEEEVPMYVLTNASNYWGAGCILYPGMLQACAEKIGNEFYLLPSSIHEMIFIPCDEVSEPEELIRMVRDINRTQVSLLDRLSDHIYKYDRETNILSMLDIEDDDMGQKKVTVRSKISLVAGMDELLSLKGTYLDSRNSITQKEED